MRIITIDTGTGRANKHAYQLTSDSAGSEILAVKDHQFPFEECNCKGFGDKPLPTDKPSKSGVKKVYLIDLKGTKDVSSMRGDRPSCITH